MRHPIPRLLTLLLASSVTLLIGASAVPSASQQDPEADTAGLVLFTSDRANPSSRGMCNNCEDIYVMPPEPDFLGTTATRLTFGGGVFGDITAYNSNGPDWSNQKQLIAFHSNRVNRTPQIFLMNRDGSEPQMLVSLTGGAAFPSFSRTGNQLCFHGQGTQRDIYIVNRDGTNLINLTAPLPGDPAPSGANIRCDWAAKGNAIAFTSDRDGDQDIYVIQADGTGLHQLTDEEGSDANPAFSPKGDLIAFESNRAGSPEKDWKDKPEIWVMNSNGDDPQRLTFLGDEPQPATYSLSKPTWSPKGDRISFHRRVLGPKGPGELGHLEIFTMNADGSDITRITFTDDPGFSGFPSWGKWSAPEGVSLKQ
jgi:Tol biopolymer transport system component